MPPKAKNKHGGKREGAGRKKGSRNQPKGQLSMHTKPGAMLKCINDTRKKGPEAITVEAAREKRAAAEQLAIEQQERDRQKREDQRKEEQKKEQERLLIMQEERKKNEKAAAEALARFQDCVEASIGNNNAPGGSGGGDGDGGDGVDDDDDDDCEDHDDIADSNPDEAYDRDEDNGAPSGRASWKCKPPLDSDLGQCLERKKTNIANEVQLSLHATAGTCWFPPTKSAAEDIEVKTSGFCEEQAWICSFCPFGSRSLATKKVEECECVCCGEVGGLEFNGWHCRPQTWFDKTVWLLHRRVRCRKKECGESWATFHPNFMKQLPNASVERFPFLTTVSGIGVHSAMLTQFLFLATKGVLFGAHAKSINEMKKTKCWRDVLSHQDLSSDKLDGLRDWVHSFVPTVFPPCNSVGKYNGMPLRKSPVRKPFIQFMDSRELHMQHSFQPQHDESEASDHSFKCSKQTMVANGAGNAFTATYDSVSLAGCCTFNRFCHTKSNDEIKPLVKKVKEVRINAGVAELKRCEGDGGGDRSLWPAVFPELLTNTKPPQKKSKNGNVVASLEENQCMCFTSVQQVNNWALSLATKVEALSGKAHCGIDTEWNMDATSHVARVMQICFPSNTYDVVVVLDLTEMGWFEDVKCPEGLKTLLLNDNLTPVAVQVSQDLPRIRKLGIDLTNSVELMTLGGQVHPGIHRGHNMKKMAERALGLEVDKTHQRGTDWTLMKDRKDYQACAALDAHIHLLPRHKSVELVEPAKKDGTMPNTNVEIGNKVHLTCRNKTAAVGELQFIGNNEGERRKWGLMTVGKGNGARRKGLVNFGMPCCDMMDRTQLRMMKLHGCDPFPSHTNQTLFKPVEDYVAVGVGPLNCEDECVTKSDEPSDVLSGDLKFLAERMKLVGPPLHVSHPKEKKTFNDFMGSLNVNPGNKQWDELASLFLQKADCMTIFPKLPSMLKKHCNKWKGTQELVSVKNSIQVDYCGLLKRLGDPKVDNDTINVAADFQKTASDDNRMQQQSGGNDDNGAEFTIPDDIPDDPLPVPPAAAHTQTECVVSAVDGRSRHGGKVCAAAKYGCPNCADCSWRLPEDCKLVKSGDIKIPETEEEKKAATLKFRKTTKAKSAAEARKKKREEKEAAAAAAAAKENNSNSDI